MAFPAACAPRAVAHPRGLARMRRMPANMRGRRIFRRRRRRRRRRPPLRTLASCLRRSKSRCLFRTWRRRVLSCAEERRDVEKATRHRSGRHLSNVAGGAARGGVREHAHAKASTFHRRRRSNPNWPRGASARRVRHLTDLTRSRHQEKVVHGALNAYVRVRRLAPAWRAWWRFHVTCDVARDRAEQPARQAFTIFPRRRRVRQVENVHPAHEARADGACRRGRGRQDGAVGRTRAGAGRVDRRDHSRTRRSDRRRIKTAFLRSEESVLESFD